MHGGTAAKSVTLYRVFGVQRFFANAIAKFAIPSAKTSARRKRYMV
jgi:hypothetical protein